MVSHDNFQHEHDFHKIKTSLKIGKKKIQGKITETAGYHIRTHEENIKMQSSQDSNSN